MKIHARKDENGTWRDGNGILVENGTSGVVYYYGKCVPAETRRTTCTISSSRPHLSSNLAIHSDQVPKFNKECGPGVHYESNGVMSSNSYAAREREARRRGKSFE